MAITIDWTTKVISVPQADLTLISGTLYELDTDWFRLQLKDIEDGEGMPFPDTHRHNTEVTVAGTTYARTIEIINGYSVEFEDGQYSVRLVGSNNNIFDVENGILVQNQVQVIPTNSAGLIVVTQQAPLDIELFRKILQNRKVTDPVTGILTIYDDDDVTPLLTANIYEDASGTVPYRSRGLERQDRLT